jgi:hypothetical protein
MSMTFKAKIALFAALAAVSISSPGFAQSLSREGSLLPHYFNGSGEIVWGAWGPPPAVAPHRVARALAVDPHQVAQAGSHRVARANAVAPHQVARVGKRRHVAELV